MIVSTKVFGKHIGRSRSYVCDLIHDMERMGYNVSKDGRTVLIDDKDAADCIRRRSAERSSGILQKKVIKGRISTFYITETECPSSEGQKGGS